MEEHLPFRCGVSDHLRVTLDNKWRKPQLTYYVSAYVPGIPASTFDGILAAAWKGWMDVCGIQVLRTVSRETASLILATGRGGRSGFDGRGGTLAWAELPPGDDRQLLMRFDADEDWNEPLLEAVAEHEFGHLLGLDHSRLKTALMYPYVNLRINRPQPLDDIPRIQALYGPATAPPPAPVPPPKGGGGRSLIEVILEILLKLFGKSMNVGERAWLVNKLVDELGGPHPPATPEDIELLARMLRAD